ncbi:uncharacterized protein LOC106129578 [Amyelois transitella]|uniref:uncharacterized protein LOC106129578 n=1 Tax=Amyelois transitella TaxID=680683 RepID=UPI00298F7CF4|nr:uncharacterized protein LOC106129578 [Amyelois transitella]
MGENLLLIKSIEKYPCLYNHQSSEYLKKESTDEAWNEVAKENNLTVNECKEKWRNLRYGFVRSLRLNPDGSAKKKYYLHDEMAFILPFVKLLNKPTPSYVYLQAGDGDTDEELIENNVELCQSPQEDIEMNHEPPRKRAKFNELNGKHNSLYLPNKTLISGKLEDPRTMFLLSLIPEIMDLTEYQMKMFRRKVLALIDDITETQAHCDNDLNVRKGESKLHIDVIKTKM